MVARFENAEIGRIWQNYLGLSYTEVIRGFSYTHNGDDTHKSYTEVYNYKTSRTSKVKAMINPNLAEAHSKAAFTVMNV